SRRRHTRFSRDWSSDLCSSDLPGSPLERRRTFRWRDLEGQSLVLFEAGTAVRALIDQHLARAGIAVEVAMELRSIESIKQMVARSEERRVGNESEKARRRKNSS